MDAALGWAELMLSGLWKSDVRPVIGMLHIPALPGAPQSTLRRQQIVDFVLKDAEALCKGGVDGLLLENFGDVPFYPRNVPRHVVASMTALAVQVRQRFDVPLGINVLRNDGRSALAIAAASEAQFVRVNVLSGARISDQGLIQSDAHRLLRLRQTLGADNIRILADVDVKHSAPLGGQSLEAEAEDLQRRSLADALIVSGRATGQMTAASDLQRVREASSLPLLVGSGVSAETIGRLPADGFIVGSGLKHDGDVRQPVDLQRVLRLMEQRPSQGQP